MEFDLQRYYGEQLAEGLAPKRTGLYVGLGLAGLGAAAVATYFGVFGGKAQEQVHRVVDPNLLRLGELMPGSGKAASPPVVAAAAPAAPKAPATVAELKPEHLGVPDLGVPGAA